MKQVGIADLKAHLSGHLRTVKKGETLLVLEPSRRMTSPSPLPRERAASRSSACERSAPID